MRTGLNFGRLTAVNVNGADRHDRNGVPDAPGGADQR